MPKNISIQQMDVKMSPSIAVTIQLSLVIPLQGKTIEEVEEGFRGVFADAACKCMGKYVEKRDKCKIFPLKDN